MNRNFNWKFMLFIELSTELLSSWESLAKWSENAAEAKRLQEEMQQLNVVIKGYGTLTNVLLESKEAIQITIQTFQVRNSNNFQQDW